MFPGQGSQYIGMGKEFYEQIPICKEVYDLASEVTGLDIPALCFEENEKINITEYTQICMLATEAAIYMALEQNGYQPDVTAGLSLGEYGALVASGVMTAEEAFELVRKRGIFMQEAVPAGGAMAAVLGLDAAAIEQICRDTAEQTGSEVSIANYNCPGQIVISGQEEAVHAVSQAVKRGRVGLKDPNRPIGSFLFLGPTGVGKTELSKALAQAVFGSEQAMIRVDMSEYMEKHSVSKLIGSPPGYVGYDEGGQLSEKVRRNPYSVILFDEIEKAHPDVFNILLQVLDDGHITDAHGRKVDFKQTIIIMTSNAGAQAIVEPKQLGFISQKDEKKDYEKMKSGVMEEVRRLFKPEFLNRIDEIMVFHTLNKEEIRKIVLLLLKSLEKRCEEQMDIHLNVTNSAVDYIAEAGFDAKYGARPLRRAIQSKIEDRLANELLEGKIKRGDIVQVQYRNKEIRFIVK